MPLRRSRLLHLAPAQLGEGGDVAQRPRLPLLLEAGLGGGGLQRLVLLGQPLGSHQRAAAGAQERGRAVRERCLGREKHWARKQATACTCREDGRTPAHTPNSLLRQRQAQAAPFRSRGVASRIPAAPLHRLLPRRQHAALLLGRQAQHLDGLQVGALAQHLLQPVHCRRAQGLTGWAR